MATDLERLVVSLDADIRKFDRSLKNATATFNGEARKIETRAKAMQRNVQSSFADLGKGLAIGAGVAAGAMAFKELADAATRTQNSLKVAGLAGQELTSVYEQLFKIAQDNATPLEEIVRLYGKVSQSQKDLGISSAQVVKFTENVAKSLRVGGKSAAETQGALLQLGQALGGTKIQAEEFNSLIDGAQPLLQAVAAGMDRAGGSVSRLTQLVKAGEVTSKEFFQAFERGAPILDQKLAGSVLTIDQALVKMRNSLQDSVGRIDSVLGISAKTVEIIGRLAQAVSSLGEAFTLVSGSPMGQFIGQINTLQSKLNPLYNAIGALEGAINSLPGAIRSSQLAGAEDDIVVITDALGEMFDRFADAPDDWVSPKVKSDLAELKSLIDENAISADDAKKKFQEIAKGTTFMGGEMSSGNSFIAAQTDQFNEFIDVIGTTITKVKQLKEEMLDEITIDGEAPGISARPVDAARDTSIYSDTMKRDQFFQQRNADAMKNELEQNVDTRAKAIIDAAAKLGVTLTEAAAKIQARSEIATEQGVKTFEGAISGYVDRVVSVESGGNTNAKNPDSTATGLGQFIESTWLDLFRRHFPAEAAGMSNSAILALRTDATKSKALIEAYARENAAVLQKAGVSVDEAALQLSHFLGAGDAAKVLSAAPGTPLKGLISSSSIAANPTILGGGRTVDDAIAYAQKRAGMTTTGTQAIESKESFAEKLAEQQRMLQQLKEETGIRASLNPLVSDYGLKLSEMQKAQELFNLAQEEGTAAGRELTSATQLLSGDLTALTPEARAQAEAMRALATQYGQTAAAAEQLKTTQEAAAASSTESLELAKSVTGGILSDIRSALSDGKITWKEWGEIAVNALNKVADKLQEMLLNQLFSPTSGAGGLLGLLTGGGGFTPNTTLGGFLGAFNKGGYTGDGGVNQPAGIVHKGEYVFDADAVRRIGVENLAALRGYASGGLVGGLPRLPTVRGVGGAAQDVHVYVDDEGSVRAYVQREGRRIEARVATTTRATFDNYRKNDLHGDIDNHMKNQRRRG